MKKKSIASTMIARAYFNLHVIVASIIVYCALQPYVYTRQVTLANT